MNELHEAINTSTSALLQQQHEDGHFCFELEADSTIPAEYILMMHFLDEVDEPLQEKLANYLRSVQDQQGGWPLFYGGEPDISATVKAYYALKLAGDDEQQEHMLKAKQVVLGLGGAAKANVFTRITLALFEQLPWRGVPFMPVEVILLPKISPFHISKVSYWSRTVMIPLLVLCSLRAKAKNPRNIHIAELFTTPPFEEKNYFDYRSLLNKVFLSLERFGKLVEPTIPSPIRNRAVKAAEEWVIKRLNGEYGLGAIFPAMVNALEMLSILGYEKNHPYRQQAKKALEDLIHHRGEQAYCQPCTSPIWDTGLACLALQEVTECKRSPEVDKALDWLAAKQLIDKEGDWQMHKPHVNGGGWAFQYQNDYYPDLDDTAVIAWTMQQANTEGQYTYNIQRASEWLMGMQCTNGGFASFEVDNTHTYLNEIPFADHGALLDPPTSDVSARCLTLFSKLQHEKYEDTATQTLNYLLSEQESDGSWFGRWGTNYIYGTWSALVALETAGFANDHPAIVKAVRWLKSQQNPDGGWGESNGSYYKPHKMELKGSTSFQTAWALLGLMAAGEADSIEVEEGIQYLINTQDENGLWNEPWFTCPGFPRVFYLKYHGYSKYFPIWALAKYRNLINYSDSSV